MALNSVRFLNDASLSRLFLLSLFIPYLFIHGTISSSGRPTVITSTVSGLKSKTTTSHKVAWTISGETPDLFPLSEHLAVCH
ncbi:hypothetical protein F5Y12DRAFT_748807 [Xylaria sp. FL1777]|nr:hypothetical protein F5Y12DRAFT_748807 [Xylaria sp. FL1777]